MHTAPKQQVNISCLLRGVAFFKILIYCLRLLININKGLFLFIHFYSSKRQLGVTGAEMAFVLANLHACAQYAVY